MKIAPKTRENGWGKSIIPAKVIEAGWNDKYIIAKQVELINDPKSNNGTEIPDIKNYHFWILEIKNGKVIGPLRGEKMFIWSIMIAISIPGILFMSLAERKLQDNLENNSERIPIYVSFLTHTILVLIFSGIGTFLIFKVLGKDIVFVKYIGQAVAVGIFSSLGHVLFYYGFYKRFLDEETFLKIEQQRHSVGLGARVFYGGVIEEIIFRWGIMTLIIWIMSLFVDINKIVVFAAIILSSILFTLVHFLGILGMKKSRLLYSYAIIGNVWVGIFCGWQFWTNGIFAAMIVHMLFHLLLYPFELRNLRKMNMLEESSLKG